MFDFESYKAFLAIIMFFFRLIEIQDVCNDLCGKLEFFYGSVYNLFFCLLFIAQVKACIR